MNHSIEQIMTACCSLPTSLRARSGAVFYSGSEAFLRPSRVYILGLNPGGSPVRQAANTVQADLDAWTQMPARYSRYLDDSWEGKAPGSHGMQPRMRHMFEKIGVDARTTPSSNLVFVRSAGEADLSAEKASLLSACWPVHQAVLEATGADTIICLGSTAGRWVRERVRADRQTDSYSETNDRGWTSLAHESRDGFAVLTLTHPGRTNWCNPKSDPSPLVARTLVR